MCGLTAALFLTVSASAEYYIVPADIEMIADADAIAIVRITKIQSELAGEKNIVTNIEVEPELVLKGELDPAGVTLVEPGGEVDGRIMVVSATPTYWVDNRALVFLTRTEEGTWRTWGAALGKFDFVIDTAGRELAVRFATAEDAASLWTPEGKPHDEKLRDARLFVDFIRDYITLGGQPKVPGRPAVEAQSAPADYFVERAPGNLSVPEGWDVAVTGATTFPPSAYTQGKFRWVAFEDGAVTFRSNGDQPGYDEVGAAQRALAAWTNDPGSNVLYLYGGTTDAGFEGDGENTILYNQSTGVPAGAIAFAQWWGGEEHGYKGETFFSITEGDVIVKSNLTVSAKVFDEAITHELGHTLGFRHSDAGTPSSTQAVMKSVLSGNYGATLGPWDIDAVRTVYDPAVKAVRLSPANLVATATSATTVVITWSPPAIEVTGYQLDRSSNGGGFNRIATPGGTSFTDTGLTPGTTYVYRVRAVRTNTQVTAYSNRDHATTIMFTDDPLVPGDTPVKAVHLTELRTAVNAVRRAAGLATVGWTDPSPQGVPVKAVHIAELRNALTPALTSEILAKPAPSYSGGAAPGETIRGEHFQEIRNLVK